MQQGQARAVRRLAGSDHVGEDDRGAGALVNADGVDLHRMPRRASQLFRLSKAQAGCESSGGQQGKGRSDDEPAARAVAGVSQSVFTLALMWSTVFLQL